MATKKKKVQEPQDEVAPESQPEQTVLMLANDSIGLIRELLQLALLTGTNIIDHLRLMKLVVGPDGKLEPEEAYIEAYNKSIAAMAEQAEAMRAEAIEKAKRAGATGTVTVQ